MRIARFPALPLAFAFILAACHKEPEQQPQAPSIADLSKELQATAQKSIAMPPLTDEQVLLSAPPGGAGPRAEAVIKLAAEAGGIAFSGTASSGGGVSVLASIPANNADAFNASINGKPAPMSSPASSHFTVFQIDIQEQAAPSPSP